MAFYHRRTRAVYASRYRNGACVTLSRYGYEVQSRYDGARAAAGDYGVPGKLPSGAMGGIAIAETQAIAEALPGNGGVRGKFP